VHIWGTNYAGHFLLEAKKLGYAVPDDLLANWIRFQKSRALSGNDTVKERVYRVYLLALAGETVLNEMNALRENSYASMDNADKWVLASAYALSGYKDRARELIAKADISIKDYREYGGTYGSPLRDRAMILEAMTVLQVWDRSSDLYEDIAGSISRQEYWYSTQELGYSLLAIGKYLINYGMSVGQQTPVMKGTIILPDGKRVPFFESKLKFEYPITNGFGKQLSIIIDKETSLPVCFLTLEYSGVPLKPAYYEDFSHNLEIGVEYYDEDGTRIDPARLTPGFTFYAIFHARKLDRYKPLEELALVQILPTGWEIDNTRLSGESMPDWLSSRARSLVLNREEYMDIRDDRIMWFFDMKEYNSYTYDFIVRLSTVTEGTFVWPPVIFEAMYDNKYQALQGSDRQKGFRTVVVDKSVIPTRWDGR